MLAVIATRRRDGSAEGRWQVTTGEQFLIHEHRVLRARYERSLELIGKIEAIVCHPLGDPTAEEQILQHIQAFRSVLPTPDEGMLNRGWPEARRPHVESR